jgi:hypothetical protein
MSTVLEKVQKLASGRKFDLRRGDYIFERILAKTDKFLVYDTQSKKKPLYTIPEEKFEEEWTHSTVVRLTKLSTDDNRSKALLDQFEIRKSINYETCPHLLTFHDQGLIQWGGNVYYATRYDDPCRDFEYWVNVDHQGLEIEALDCFRLARGCLESFAYLEEGGFVLTQFNQKNLYVGSFSEDRGNFFRTMFKGHKNKSAEFPHFKNKSMFSAPESEGKDIYKSHSFTVGLMILWAIYTTNNKGNEFPHDIHANASKLSDLIKNAVDICYKEGKEKPEHKELFKVFLEDLLEPNLEKRRSAKELLTYKWIIESDKLDYEEYQREVEENERAKQKEKEEEEKNKFN